MPSIILTLSSDACEPLMANQLAEELAQLTCRILKKEIERTSVLIQYHPKDQWFIAGQPLAKDGRNAFRLTVTITDETNTKTEKATYHKAAFILLSERIEHVHPLSNIHIIDCRASAYGYGGITQEAYYANPQER